LTYMFVAVLLDLIGNCSSSWNANQYSYCLGISHKIRAWNCHHHWTSEAAKVDILVWVVKTNKKFDICISAILISKL
jgi:hypothetical protein